MHGGCILIGMENKKEVFVLYLIFGALVVISGVLFSINGVLKDIREAVEYSSASTDYLFDIKTVLEQ